MTPNQRNVVAAALAEYGASLDADDFIVKKTRSSVRVEVAKGRLRFVAGGRLASYPVGAAGVRDFVEKFWFWKKEPTK